MAPTRRESRLAESASSTNNFNHSTSFRALPRSQTLFARSTKRSLIYCETQFVRGTDSRFAIRRGNRRFACLDLYVDASSLIPLQSTRDHAPKSRCPPSGTCTHIAIHPLSQSLPGSLCTARDRSSPRMFGRLYEVALGLAQIVVYLIAIPTFYLPILSFEAVHAVFCAKRRAHPKSALITGR
jgi:hypothetical protein